MGTKKDIGTVFKQALSGYSAQPDDIWGNIEAQLKRARRRKLFLLWLLCFLIFIPSTFLIYEYNVTPIPKKDSNEVLVLGKPIENETETEIILNNIDPNDGKAAKIKDPISNSHIEIAKTNIKSSNKNKNTDSKLSLINDQKIDASSSYKRIEAMPIKRIAATQDSLDLNELNSKLKPKKKSDILDEEAKDEDGNTFTRWSVFPNVSLDHYNAFNRETSKQYTLNKGLFIQYRGTKKMAFRIGYKELNLQYNFQSLNNESQQKVSYTEIPLEIKYALNSKYKIKPSIITGFSYLFLEDASILNVNNNTTTTNKALFRRQVFSLNLGLGLQYEINKRWDFNLESTFKLHPYPYTKSVGFYPYTISVSAGIQYNFKF